MIDVLTLTDGGQEPMDVARRIEAFVGAARETLELALYDVRLPSPVAEVVRGAIVGAAERGVAVRLAYNLDHRKPIPVPPPPSTEPALVETLGVPTRQIPGDRDLMHHKYMVRDRASVWTGSTNWTADSWSREENLVVVVDSPGLAQAYAANFQELWSTAEVEKTGRGRPDPVDVAGIRVRPWFCPGHGDELSHRVASAVGRARRVRVASPVITAGPILGTLAQVAGDGRADLAGVVDSTQVEEVVRQWRANGSAAWKLPALAAILQGGAFTGKHSTPYRPGSVHDYMHAKVTVADSTVFLGSFNLSHSGEMNAENVLEIEDPALADRMAAYVDDVRARYPPAELPPAPRA
ncbi:MAG: phospholipase D-like domain-containing protein [Actinomycetota bacterium]|nr:phospholipase D-like domain-containing protein [Actinomycetota bacterium]